MISGIKSTALVRLRISAHLWSKIVKKLKKQGLSQLSMVIFIENIPGISLQVLTFPFMIGAMVLITF